jgi:hypothetical protein
MLKRDTVVNNQNCLSYKKATEDLLQAIDGALGHFKTADFKLRNDDKKPVVKILKEEYDKLRLENENLMLENKKLRKDNKGVAGGAAESGMNVNKVVL